MPLNEAVNVLVTEAPDAVKRSGERTCDRGSRCR